MNNVVTIGQSTLNLERESNSQNYTGNNTRSYTNTISNSNSNYTIRIDNNVRRAGGM